MIPERFARHRLNEIQIETALNAIPALLRSQEQVIFAYLHGSVLDYQHGVQRLLPRDIDLAIYLSEGDWIAVELRLQSDFYRRTGLSPEVLDVHTLNNAPISAGMEITRRGILVFCRDTIRHADYLERISNSYRRLAGFFDAANA